MSADKNTKSENDTIDQLDLIGNYRALHPQTTEYTFFSNAHRMFSGMGHILGHKTSLNKFKVTKKKLYQAFF